MALRTIRILGDPVLEKICRPVAELTPRLRTLIGDMFETMYEAAGVGLAAPQVGVLRRIVVIDCGIEEKQPYVFINPEILETEGNQTGDEGCLSYPGKCGTVTRPEKVKVRALDINMEPFELEAEGLLARAVCHECDHLDGKMYVSLVEGEIRDAVYEEEEEEETEE
ncbi:MAG: peptide deformylase [Lachnospiraceae bacterium]|nr:peptide deformylase [Lachnospiraceae bacterium]